MRRLSCAQRAQNAPKHLVLEEMCWVTAEDEALKESYDKCVECPEQHSGSQKQRGFNAKTVKA